MHLRHSGCHCRVVYRILERYDALKLFFTDAVFTDRLQAAQTILNILNYPVQKLYLSFFEFMLEIFNKLNRQMQLVKPQIHLLYTVMSSTVRTLLDCFNSGQNLNSTAIENVQFRNPKYVSQLENMYLGEKVNALKFPAIVTEDRLQSLDMKWRLLRNHKFDFDENVSAEEFWIHVKYLNAGDGSPMLPHLILFVEAMLCSHIPVQTWK
ncbi:hypothetical protein PR048_009842 [Dryococelus australis]|uniref:Transposase n=1 Tax=Dryococelus australis TaxID=614101 RepID=A0ABQ9I215_9NEOP|nr:hypothetical protein PR048_009842 [Dryococelus australis]